MYMIIIHSYTLVYLLPNKILTLGLRQDALLQSLKSKNLKNTYMYLEMTYYYDSMIKGLNL